MSAEKCMLTDEQLQSLYKLAWVNRPVEGFIEEARAYLSASAAPAEGREAVDDVASLVDEWIRSRGTSMDGESYAAAVQLAAFIKTRPATAPQAATTAGAVDERAAFTRLQRDYDSLKSLCANAEVTAAEAQAELKKARAALATAPTMSEGAPIRMARVIGPVSTHRTHPNQAYVTLGFGSEERCTEFMKALNRLYTHPASEPITDAAREFGDKEARRIYDEACLTVMQKKLPSLTFDAWCAAFIPALLAEIDRAGAKGGSDDA